MSESQWSLSELADNIKETLAVDKDFPVIIDGLTGAGKSTFAVQLAKKGCPWFDLEKDIIFSQDELIQQITTARPGSFIVPDEAINMLFKRDFMTKKQKFIIRLLDMCRDRNLCLLMCVPNFWSIDKHVLEGRIKLRVHIARTGLAFMWKPTENPFTPDKWNRKYNEKVCKNWDLYPNAKTTKGFIGYVNYGDMCEGDKKIYLEVKRVKKEEIKKREEDEEKKNQIDKEKGFVLGETMTLSVLKKQGLLKPGAVSVYASLRNIELSTLSKRMSSLAAKEHEVESLELSKLYNNDYLKANFNQTDEENLS